MKWYKRDPAAALEGMLGLTAEERGYYNALIDLLYARAPHGTVTDELVVKAVGERPMVWRRVKASLIAKGKVHEVEGRLTANRVDNTLISASKVMDKWSRINAVSDLKRAEINNLVYGVPFRGLGTKPDPERKN